MTLFTRPCVAQIETAAAAMVANLGNAVHLRASELALSVDVKFPGMPDAVFDQVRIECAGVADSLRNQALRRLWA